MKPDIIVIGGGITGCSSAYYLAKAGYQVTLLEKDLAVGQEASGRNCCGVRQHGRKAALPLSMVSVRLWKILQDELDDDLEYQRTGNLKVRFNEADLQILEEETVWEHEQGLTEARMMSKDECLEMIPGLTETIVGGKYCPTDGIASPILAPRGIARGAEQLGAKILTDTAATGILIQGSRVVGVTTVSGKIEAAAVINAAGPWAARFNELAGCNTPTRPHMTHLLITERLPHKFTPWLGFGIGAVELVQQKTGNFAMGAGRPLKPLTTYQKDVNHTSITRGVRRLIEVLPWLANVNFIRSLSGIIAASPDHEPYIGAIPGVEGLYTACGFSGQGFCLGPAVGKVLTELIAGKEPSVSLAPFRPDRFSHMKWPEFELLV